MNLTDQRVLLTGATGGLGHAIAQALVANGAGVLASGRRAEQLDRLVQDLGVEIACCDLAQPDAVATLVAAAGDTDVLVANAALPASGPLDDFSAAEVDRAIDVNLRAPIQLVRAVVPGMVVRGRGHVVLMASMGAKMATAGLSLYNATKFGLRGFALALRQELAPSGVGVSAIFPGIVRDTGMWADAGLPVPRGVRTRSADDVAQAVVRSIQFNLAEIDVAPFSVRLLGRVAGAAPALFTRVTGRSSAGPSPREFGDAYRDKR